MSKLCGTTNGEVKENGKNIMQVRMRMVKNNVMTGIRIIFTITEYNGKLWKK